MVERSDAGRGHSHQYFPVRDRWFRKIDQLQLFITIESFCSHCTHIRSPFQTCALPPSTKSSIPVTKLESSEARNNAALATSSGSPMRPIGIVDTIRAIASAGCPSIAGVSVGPGLITFERIWRSLRSEVQVRTKERRAAFVAP